MHTSTWNVEISINEDEDATTARAVLSTELGGVAEATGTAHRDPHDPAIPEIGKELAAGRALVHLAQRMLRLAEDDISAVTHQPAHVHP